VKEQEMYEDVLLGAFLKDASPAMRAYSRAIARANDERRRARNRAWVAYQNEIEPLVESARKHLAKAGVLTKVRS